MATLTGLSLPRVDLPSWSSHALATLPEGPALGLMAAVLTTTLVCSVQSLLGAIAVDKLVAARPGPPAPVPRADLDRELVGQGVANIVSGALGGLPVAGVAVRSTANVRAGALSRNSTILHGVFVMLAALLLFPLLELIPLAALASLVMAVGLQMVSLHHIRTVTRHREAPVYVATVLGVVLMGVLEGVALGVGAAVGVALHRLTRTRITHEERHGVHHIRVRGQLTFLAVPRLSRTLHLVPQGAGAVVELDGSFVDHAAHESLEDWRRAHLALGGSVELAGRQGEMRASEMRQSLVTGGTRTMPAEQSTVVTGNPSGERRPVTDQPSTCQTNGIHASADQQKAPRSGQADARPADTGRASAGHQLIRGISAFHRNTAPLVRGELARLAREGQRPAQLFLTCADSRLVTSMITSSGPGDLFVVRNVGNLVPLPGEESGDDSVAAAIEYAVEVLRVRSITVCGHSGCGAMQALLCSDPGGGGARTPLKRWLRHGEPSLERLRSGGHPAARLAGRQPADDIERLCLTNVVQQLDHLRAHESVDRALKDGSLEVHGLYFHVGEARAYLLDESGDEQVFDHVGDTEGGEVGGGCAKAAEGLPDPA